MKTRKDRIIAVGMLATDVCIWAIIYLVFFTVAAWFCYTAQNPIDELTDSKNWIAGLMSAVFVLVFAWLTRKTYKDIKNDLKLW